MFVVLPDSLFPLRFPDLGLLVPLGHNVLESGSDDGPLELLGLLGPLLGGLLLNTLLVLAPVEDGPACLPGVSLQEVSLVGPVVQEPEDLKRENNYYISVHCSKGLYNFDGIAQLPTTNSTMNR